MIDPYNGRQICPVCGAIVGLNVQKKIVGHKNERGGRCHGEGQQPVPIKENRP